MFMNDNFELFCYNTINQPSVIFEIFCAGTARTIFKKIDRWRDDESLITIIL